MEIRSQRKSLFVDMNILNNSPCFDDVTNEIVGRVSRDTGGQ